jgi:hypothetical protein
MGNRFCVVAMFVAWEKVQPLAAVLYERTVAPLGPRSNEVRSAIPDSPVLLLLDVPKIQLRVDKFSGLLRSF